MSLYPLKTFNHPHSVYRLEYPSHWDQITQKEGESCGFGPHERDDVGLWISIIPMSIDTERLQEDLPKLMKQALKDSDTANLRRDTSMRDYAMVADVQKEGQGGFYWIVTGGDVVLLASTQVPVAERDVWNPLFQEVMASLQITRDDQLFERQVANDLLAALRERHPEQDFHFDKNHIRGSDRVVYLSNILREIRGMPEDRTKIISRFVETLSQPATSDFGHEIWDEIKGAIVPVIKPREYVDPDGPTRHLQTSDWLPDVLICYAIKSKNMFRFVTGWDVNRWEQTPESLHETALANLARLPWPRELVGARTKDYGRIIVVDTDDKLASSRLLHPDLHKLFSGPLGRTFLAGIPCRERLVLFSDRRDMKKRIGRRLKKDHDSSAYPITPRPFQVTRDGIAAAPGK
ncbi:MAG TPA: hypothetical protein VGZ25_02630 [Gemmataceae bacterium]|nr:hypothetical protein [Gemmataceae bacterium]